MKPDQDRAVELRLVLEVAIADACRQAALGVPEGEPMPDDFSARVADALIEQLMTSGYVIVRSEELLP